MNIIITGASKGIGYATAALLASNPDNKVIVISRDEVLLGELATQSATGNIISIPFDLSEPKSAYDSKLKDRIMKEVNQVDVLINNAGYLVNKPFEELSEEDMNDVFSVNVNGIVKLSQLLLPFMGGERRSHIINIGSVGGYQGSSKFSGLSIYSASKGAVSILSECMAEEFKDKNIAVNCLALGAVQTEMLAKAFPGFDAPIKADDMAKYIAEFALKGMDEFNGEVIPVELDHPL